MPDIYEVQAPDGSTLEIQSTGVPTADVAKRAIRAYGDAQAAAAQKKAEAGSTLGSQLTPENVLHDLGTIGSTVGGAVKSLVTEGWKNPLGLNPPERQLTDEQINAIAKGGLTGAAQNVGADMGRLRTNAAQTVTSNPLDILQRAGVTPDAAARAGATTAVAALTPVVLPNAGKLANAARSGVGSTMEVTGQGMTTVGENLNPLTTAAGTGLVGNLIGGPKGAAIGSAVGGMTPSLMRGTGRLITAAGRAIQPAEVPVPPTPIPAALRPTGTGSPMEPVPPSGMPPWAAPPPREPIVPPPTGTGNVATPTEGPGPYTGRAPAPEPPVPPATETAATPAGPMPGASWEQFIRNVVRIAPAETPPATETAAAMTPAAETAAAQAEPVSTAQGSLRDQLIASVQKAAQEGTAATPAAIDTELAAKAENLNRPAETAPAGADEAEAAGITEEPEGAGTIPSREQMTTDELSRAREGARDSPDRQPGETVEDYRLRTRGRATGEHTEEASIIPARRAKAIDDTIESMYQRNATDQEFRDYLDKSKNHPKKGEIAAKIESKAHSYKRASPLAHVITGAVATGAALRNALVNQLQDKKDDQQ